MSLSFPLPTRAVVMAGAAFLLLLAALGMMVLRPFAASDAADPAPLVVHHPVRPAAVKSQTRSHPHAAKRRTAPAHAKPHAARAARTKTRATSAVTTNGLPLPLARALAAHPVVVVALFSRGAAVDKAAMAEARAGADDAGAGFVALDVYRQANAAPVNAKFDVLANPVVLVVTRPETVFWRSRGFADRESIAQAAFNAR